MKQSILGLLALLLVMLAFFSSSMAYTGNIVLSESERSFRGDDPSVDVSTWRTYDHLTVSPGVSSVYGQSSPSLYQRQLRSSIGIAGQREQLPLTKYLSYDNVLYFLDDPLRAAYGVFGVALPGNIGDVDFDGDVDPRDCSLINQLVAHNKEFRHSRSTDDSTVIIDDPSDFNDIGKPTTRYQYIYSERADTDGDGEVDLVDALRVCELARGGEKRVQSTLMQNDCQAGRRACSPQDDTTIDTCRPTIYGYNEWVPEKCPVGTRCQHQGGTREDPTPTAYCTSITSRGYQEETTDIYVTS